MEAEQDWYDGNNANYRNRRQLAGEIMHTLGCTYDENQVGMFLWGKIPDSCTDVEELTEHVLQDVYKRQVIYLCILLLFLLLL